MGVTDVRLGFAIAFAASTTAVLTLVSCGGKGRVTTPEKRELGVVESNVRREDYAGSRACAHCHTAIAERFENAPMHTMTRLPEQAVIKAPWNDAVFRFKDDELRLGKFGDERYVAITSKQFGSKTYRVTRVIGGHHREDFAGVEVVGVKANAQIIGSAHDELILPFSWVFATQAFRYKGYSVMLKERPGLKAGGVWAETCIFCHNTVPYLSTVLGALSASTGAKSPGFQGEIVDDRLPPDRRWSLRITDEAGLREALGKELTFLSPGDKLESGAHGALDQLVRTTKAGFDGRHFVELGIGCESCHLGSKEHVADVRVRPSFEPKASFLAVDHGDHGQDLAPAALRAQRINRACARCHQVLFSGYPYTWEGGLRKSDDLGGGNINSGEARDMLLGGCASAMSCVDCHDPHAPDNGAKLAALEGEAGDAVCQRCHEKYKTAAAIQQHTHHLAGGEGARCVACHMPKKNMSLDGGLTRYHRIGSPNDRVRVEKDRPLECGLCHAGESVASLVKMMEKWWPAGAFNRDELRKLYGDLGSSVALATLEQGKPHEQAVAMFLLGKLGGEGKATKLAKAAVPLLAKQLTHGIPIVRWYAAGALEAIFGEKSPIDLHMKNERIEADAAAWLAKHAD